MQLLDSCLRVSNSFLCRLKLADLAPIRLSMAKFALLSQKEMDASFVLRLFAFGIVVACFSPGKRRAKKTFRVRYT